MTTPGSGAYRAAQRAELLSWIPRARIAQGFGWIGSTGEVDSSRGADLWITCRMTHVAALALLAREEPSTDGPTRSELTEAAAHGVASLSGPFEDTDNGGWFAAVGTHGPTVTTKQAYGHAFVVLAATSAHLAGVVGARSLMDRALAMSEKYFWDEDDGLSCEEWNRDWSVLEDYRGVNANMHTVEAYLAAGDVTGERIWHERAARIAGRVAGWAQANGWRIPEHFDSSWQPLFEYHHAKPADPFRPYGATVGHGLEWARLLLAVDGVLGSTHGIDLRAAASALYERAVADGWYVDEQPGFIYTTDWSGVPVVRERMHWVAAEAVGAASALWLTTGEESYADDVAKWWDFIDRYLVDNRDGSWHHELSAVNTVSSTVWAGKPDIYHAYQAALWPDVPVVPSFARALASRKPG